MNSVHINTDFAAGKARVGDNPGMPDTNASVLELEQQLQHLLDQTVGAAPGVLLSVHAPLLGLDWSGAAGVASLERGDALRPEHGFRIASMSKTFTGALIARLLERGQLKLSDPITAYLPADIAGLVPVAGGHSVSEITLDLLLRHRAGFNDFAVLHHHYRVTERVNDGKVVADEQPGKALALAQFDDQVEDLRPDRDIKR